MTKIAGITCFSSAFGNKFASTVTDLVTYFTLKLYRSDFERGRREGQTEGVGHVRSDNDIVQADGGLVVTDYASMDYRTYAHPTLLLISKSRPQTSFDEGVYILSESGTRLQARLLYLYIEQQRLL